ncbi:hypothetical protein [Polaromonas sp. UC242_47]
MKKLLLAVSSVALVVFLSLLAWVSDDIDRCLDSGGRWNAKERICEK